MNLWLWPQSPAHAKRARRIRGIFQLERIWRAGLFGALAVGAVTSERSSTAVPQSTGDSAFVPRNFAHSSSVHRLPSPG